MNKLMELAAKRLRRVRRWLRWLWRLRPCLLPWRVCARLVEWLTLVLLPLIIFALRALACSRPREEALKVETEAIAPVLAQLQGPALLKALGRVPGQAEPTSRGGRSDAAGCDVRRPCASSGAPYRQRELALDLAAVRDAWLRGAVARPLPSWGPCASLVAVALGGQPACQEALVCAPGAEGYSWGREG